MHLAEIPLTSTANFNTPMRAEGHLFSNIPWRDVEESQKRAIASEVDAMDGNRLLNTSADDLVNYFMEKYRVDIPVVHKDGIAVDQRETKIDVSGDPDRHVRDRNRPFLVDGASVTVDVPFSGESIAFKIRPNPYAMNPPRGRIQDDRLVLEFSGVDMDSARLKTEVNRVLAAIESNLENLRPSAEAFNQGIPSFARSRIDARRTKLLANQGLVANLGFKIKERPGVARTFAAPNVKRKDTPALPSASTAPYKPEPALPSADYEHILEVMQNMASVMERSPKAFREMGEEDIRTQFLVHLNGHYQGDATGETFNYEGKTDILIRTEGKNIFIAECKFWSGPKGLRDTIDQLLSYVSWRDTKTAVVVFNRNKNFSKVLAEIPGAVKSHPAFKRVAPGSTDTVLRFVFGHRDDPNRELELAVMAFEVPRLDG